MPDYSKGKIYKIYSDIGNKVYVGSTTYTLSHRLGQHKTASSCSSSILFNLYGFENCKIELIIDYPCESNDELRIKEEEIRKNTKNCVNNRKAYSIGYYEENKEKWKAHVKEYASKNKEKISTWHKLYRQKDEIKERRKKKVICDCGVEYTHDHASRHKRSKHHLNYISN